MSKETIVRQTRRLVITPFSERHLTPEYVSWLNDPVTTRHSDQRFKEHTIESCKRYFTSFRDSDNFFWAIEDRSTREHYGNLTIYRDVPHGTADIGIMLGNKNVWGRGLGLEAWVGACDRLFTVEKVRKITAGTYANHAPMRKLMQRAQMVEDGVRSRQCMFEGKEVDIVYACLFCNEWKDRRSDFSSILDG